MTTNMKKELSILRNNEDGTLTLAYKGIDLDDYTYITVEEFIQEVDSADMWDFIDSKIYASALYDFGLDYNEYEDPDQMWDDFLKAVKEGE